MRLPSILALVLIAVPLGGCANDAGDPNASDAPAIVAALFPLADVARAVAGDALDVIDLTPPGSEAHDVELSTGTIDAVEDADTRMLLFVGHGFQPAVEAVRGRVEGTHIDVSEAAGAAEAAGDAHVWLDPVVMGWLVEQIGGVATTAVPDEADAIAARADAVATEMAQLHDDYTAGLRKCARREMVSAHAAFGHLAARYDLQAHAVAGSSPEAEPDAARIAEVADLVRARGITTVFAEPGEGEDVAATVAREAGVGTALLDPIEVDRGMSYVEAMRSNLASLRTALACE